MRPSSRELIEGIAAALERDVGPRLSDRWAASSLRSALQLLRHLAIRVEEEPRVLLLDTQDARETLGAVRRALTAAGAPAASVARGADIDAALAAPVPPAHETARLDAANEALQSLIERLLRDRAALEALPAGAAVHGALRAYLIRRLEREASLYFPSFTGAPF